MAVLRCPYCGERIKEGDQFCSHCGKQFDKPEIDGYSTYHQELGGMMVKCIGVLILLWTYFSMMAAWFNQMGLLFVLVMTLLLTGLTYLLLKKIF